jgi:heptosyltransferase-3
LFAFVSDKAFCYLASMPSPLPDPVDLGLVHRALVTKLRHHGDVLLASPVFTVLGRAAPAAEIDALVYVETAAMLAGHPAIAETHVIDRDWKRQGFVRQARAERALLSALSKRRYDLIVHLTEHPRGAWLSRLLRPRYSVARHLDRAHWLWRTSFTHYYRLPRRTPRHTVECNLGVQPAPGDRALVLAPNGAATARVRGLLGEHGIEPRRFIQIHPGSRWLFKCWPAGHYTTLLEQLTSDGWRIVLTGAPDPRERALVDAILAATTKPARSRITDLGGQLSLTELAALTREARAFVGVDSAPMHIAAAE